MVEETRIREFRQSFGYLRLGSGPIELNYDDIRLVDQNYGIDILMTEPVVIRASDIDITDTLILSKSGSIVVDRIRELTFVVIRFLEHNRIPGDIVLYFETIQQDYNFRVVCKAYQRHQ